MARRIGWLGVFILLCFVVLFAQLNNVQVAKAKKYATDPNNPRIAAEQYSQPRGEIQASDGTVLALSVPAPSGSIYKYQRVYPPATAQLFSQITGFDSIFTGRTGVEASYNSYLVAHNQPVKTLRDLLTTRTVTDTVNLTLDPKLQAVAANALNPPGAPLRAGAVVAIDPTTGAIKAMYSYPTYDPNPIASLNPKTFNLGWYAYNSQVQNIINPVGGLTYGLSLAYGDAGFAPGSTFKTITTSAAYDRAPLLVVKQYPTEQCIKPGTLGGQTTQQLCNFDKTEACGGDIAAMLPPSCDTGFALLGTDVGGQNMYDEATGFGFNRQPPLDLPPAPQQVSTFPLYVDHGDQILLAYSSIGQENVSVSPLQMALVAAGIANHGVIMTPHVMESIHDSQGNLVTSYQPKPWLVATSPQTAQALNGLMQLVVSQPGATASGVGFPPDEHVAAKTGTAQTLNNTAINAWMIAFAPANQPKIAVAVMIPNLRNSQYGGAGADYAGPVMKQVIAAALSGE
ncbi:MAG TPA: penicillin-binding transpeptidase domain-containing protein [Acidimicrobiales bacterium]|nr:penicillin-binding transpeptidase domain-containing protein [Acidimicrobiales bacterium]